MITSNAHTLTRASAHPLPFSFEKRRGFPQEGFAHISPLSFAVILMGEGPGVREYSIKINLHDICPVENI